MDNERLLANLGRIPTVPLLLAFLFYYIGYGYYSFMGAEDSPLTSKKKQVVAAKEENGRIKEKIKKANEFSKSLEAKKSEIQGLVQELNGMKATLSESFDVPEFMKMIITEAKKTGLVVLALKPTSQGKKEYYSESAFELSFKGAYVQLLVFLDRLAQAQKVIRTDHLVIKPKGSPYARYVELEGTVQIKGFSYLGTKADEIAQGSPEVPQSTGGAQ